MAEQQFQCDQCGVAASVDIDPCSSVYEGCDAIVTKHQLVSPDCSGDLSMIRLLNVPSRHISETHGNAAQSATGRE